MTVGGPPLTLGTAGHVDHGKTALVTALTGVDTDRLPEERARGLTIALGFAPLRLPGGRTLSLIDVPGHDRFVRTMVSGATGVDGFLLAVAADDGVMPQTREHVEILHGLGVTGGVVAVTKADLTDPAPVVEQVGELLPGCAVVACSARRRTGLAALSAALDGLAADLPSRAAAGGDARLHVDRTFTVAGRGVVVTGTLWSGVVAPEDRLELVSRRATVRVRGVEVHGRAAGAARAGQRVALNLAGSAARDVVRGDALATPGTLRGRTVLDCALMLHSARHGERVQVHHGTRDVTGRLCALGDGLWQLRLEDELLALDGDRIVVRRLAPPDTLGGGVVLDAAAHRHGRRPEILARLLRRRDGERDHHPPRVAAAPTHRPAAPPALGDSARALERELLAAGPQLLSEAQMTEAKSALGALRAARLAVRVSGRLYAHADVVAAVEARIVALLRREGEATLGGVRDALGISRKGAQAFLEHLDAGRVTRRLPDDRRILMSAHRAAARG